MTPATTRVDGGAGNDKVDGGSGNDRIDGGPATTPSAAAEAVTTSRRAPATTVVAPATARATRSPAAPARTASTADREDRVARNCERVLRGAQLELQRAGAQCAGDAAQVQRELRALGDRRGGRPSGGR